MLHRKPLTVVSGLRQAVIFLFLFLLFVRLFSGVLAERREMTTFGLELLQLVAQTSQGVMCVCVCVCVFV